MKQIDEQRYLWCLRAFGVFVSLLIALNIVLLAAFSRIAPNTRLEAFFIQTVDGNKEMIHTPRVSNLEVRQDTLGLRLARNMIIKYIIDRESQFIETAKNEALVGPDSDVFYTSAPALYQEFARSEEYQVKILNPNRMVAHVSVNEDEVRYMTRLGTWEAAFTITYMDSDGMNRRTERKTAEIEAKFDAHALVRSGRARWRNPLGFTVLKYEIKK